MRERFLRLWRSLVHLVRAPSELAVGIAALFCVGLVILILDMKYLTDREGILVEAHGLLFDIFLFACLFVWFNQLRSRRQQIQRYREELDDFRAWDAEEGVLRKVGIVKRLTELGVEKLDLSDAQLPRAELSGFELAGTNLHGANLSDANLIKANLANANLRKANLHGGNFHGANLSDADLSGADLHGADLRETNLRRADLRETNLRGADLRGMDLRERNLSEVRLSETDLHGADLHGADLSGADLSGADLSGADLSGADLSGADLGGADLGGADLHGADFREGGNSRGELLQVDLRRVKNLTCEQLRAATDWQTAYRDSELACGAGIPAPLK